MPEQTKVLATGARGFIGHHLVTFLKQRGYWVRGRNSVNTRLRQVLGWVPQISLQEGLACTYPWIEEHVCQKLKSIALESQNKTVLRGLQRLGYTR